MPRGAPLCVCVWGGGGGAHPVEQVNYTRPCSKAFLNCCIVSVVKALPHVVMDLQDAVSFGHGAPSGTGNCSLDFPPVQKFWLPIHIKPTVSGDMCIKMRNEYESDTKPAVLPAKATLRAGAPNSNCQLTVVQNRRLVRPASSNSYQIAAIEAFYNISINFLTKFHSVRQNPMVVCSVPPVGFGSFGRIVTATNKHLMCCA